MSPEIQPMPPGDGDSGRPTSPFDVIRHIEGGIEIWYAREMMPKMGYADWKNMETALARAKTACLKAGKNPADHFSDVGKMIEIGKGAQREVTDVRMTRYGCYMLAISGDPRKPENALAHDYFVTSTRSDEITKATATALPAMPDGKIDDPLEVVYQNAMMLVAITGALVEHKRATASALAQHDQKLAEHDAGIKEAKNLHWSAKNDTRKTRQAIGELKESLPAVIEEKVAAAVDERMLSRSNRVTSARIKAALADPANWDKSNGEIADMCGVRSEGAIRYHKNRMRRKPTEVRPGGKPSRSSSSEDWTG